MHDQVPSAFTSVSHRVPVALVTFTWKPGSPVPDRIGREPDDTVVMGSMTTGVTGTFTSFCTDGDHTIQAVQADSSGNPGAPAQQDVTVPVTQVGLNPITGAASGDHPVLSGTGEPGYHVTVTDSSGTLCEADVKADGTWSCTSSTPLTVGDHTLTATQTDPAGNPTSPATAQVSVPPDQVTVDPVDTSGGQRPVFSGKGEPGYHVTVMDGGNPVCTATVADDGTWSCQAAQPFTGGQHDITVVQTGPDGTPTTPAQAQVTIANATGGGTAPAGGAVEMTKDGSGWLLAGLALFAALGMVGVVLGRRSSSAASGVPGSE